MQLFEKLQATLSVEELKTLIKKAAEAETGRPVTNVSFTLKETCTGYGTNERYETVLTGAQITFGPKPVYDGRL